MCCVVRESVAMPLLKVSFEVFGRVQGVHFRAHTAKNARRLGLTGWCMNTTQGTVTGEIEGPQVRQGLLRS
jgi:acylphosphatase